MKLSVVIVNYNVKYFLEQALLAVQQAGKDIAYEVFVVDNLSTDGSIEMLKEKFPHVQLIANQKNVGFSIANNQAIRIANGEYVLLLNPDTIVAEDTFKKCISFMDAHQDAGALGVKMIDGTGAFLPESKRGLPTPWVSFCKIFGLSALFPKSPRFSKYHLGYLSRDENHVVDVLSGAFMFMRKTALDKCGLLDEDFFMYGEDIDLSYRITKAGYLNYYFAETTIIHYKGESTKKGSLNYVKAFYEAMIIYANKHFSSDKAGAYTTFIHLAIYLKAFFSLCSKVLKACWLPFVDFVVSYGVLFLIKEFWENKIMHDDAYYSSLFTCLFMPIYVFVWMLIAFLSGAYDKPIRTINIFKGVGIGTLVLTAAFGLLPNEYRFSRAIILIGAIGIVFVFFLSRFLQQFLFKNEIVFQDEDDFKILIVGEYEEAKRALTLLNESGVDFSFSGFISPRNYLLENAENLYVSNFDKLSTTAKVLKIDEIIFCTKDVFSKDVITYMEQEGSQTLYKTIPTNSNSIIGSNSRNTSGDLYAIDVNLKIGRVAERRSKRIFDFSMALVCLLCFPIFAFLNRSLLISLLELIRVLVGKKTFVGYAKTYNISHYKLPLIKEGVFSANNEFLIDELDDSLIHKINLNYAKEYTTSLDFLILLRTLFKRKN